MTFEMLNGITFSPKVTILSNRWSVPERRHRERCTHSLLPGVELCSLRSPFHSPRFGFLRRSTAHALIFYAAPPERLAMALSRCNWHQLNSVSSLGFYKLVYGSSSFSLTSLPRREARGRQIIMARDYRGKYPPTFLMPPLFFFSSGGLVASIINVVRRKCVR